MNNMKGNTLHIDASEEELVELGVVNTDTLGGPVTGEEMGDFTTLGTVKD